MKRYILLLSLCCLHIWAGLRANNGSTGPDRQPTDTTLYYKNLQELRQKHKLSAGQADEAEIQKAAAFQTTVCLQGTSPIPNEVARSLSAAVRSLACAACAGLPEGEHFSEFIDTILANRAIERIPKLVYSRYSDVRDIPAGFLSALPACNARQQGRLIAAVKQLIEFERLYQDAATIRNNVNTDYLYNVLPHLFTCALHQPDRRQAVKDLQSFSHYLSACTQYSPGSKDGLKTDGTGFHHHTHYNGYMYAYKTWVQYMGYLKGTAFRMEADAYRRIKKAVVSEYLMATLPLSGEEHYFANSLAGRHPFAGLAVDFGQELFRKLVEVGGDIKGKEIDEELAAYHNAFFPTNPYPQIAPKKLEGFYQFNYSPAGVYRHDNWVATMRCPTTVFWGGEIYNKTNRFGRYQSHGTLEILYNGALEQSGYPSGWKRFEGERGGWDWNVVPGSTTVHYTNWKEMMPNGNAADRFDQWSATTNFSGALSWGDCGLFACAFDQGDHWGSQRFVPTRLTFCKSVFAFDGILVSLGSGISAQNDYADDRLTATNLFQALAYQEESPFLLNGKKLDKETRLTLHTDKDHWLLTPCTTGYLVPAGNDPLTVSYGEQTTPGPEGTDASSFHSRCAAKAFINHGIKPAGKRYCFAVVPHTTPQAMAMLSKRLFHKKGIFEIRQQQDSLHIVKHIPSGTLAYALFAPATALREGVLQTSDTPLLLMERHDRKRNLLELAVCSPDLRPKTTEGNGKEWTSAPTLATLLLKGNWQASGSEEEGLIACSCQEGETKVVLELKEGLSLYLKFSKAAPVRGKTASAQKLDNLVELKQKSSNPLFHRLDKAPRTPAFESEGYWVWGSSVVKGDDGKYHMFVSRFPKSLPFHPGWMVASEIVHAVSDVPQGPYRFSDVALPARGAQYWDGRSTHNPRILKQNGKYYLIYMGSTHPFAEPTYEQLTLDSPWCIAARANKRIGLAMADSPYGPWKRLDEPILKTKANTFYSYLTSNPSPIIQEDGSVMMIFKGRQYTNGHQYSQMSLGIAYAPGIEGPYRVLNNDEPIFQVDGQGEAEDPFLWKDADGYHAIFKDQVGKFTGEQSGGVMAHSKDGIHWTVDKDPKAYSRTVEWEDGKVEMQGQLERPFILFEDGKPAYVFFATMDGPGGFENASHSWNMVVPIKE